VEVGVHPRDAWPTEEGRRADEHECMAWGEASVVEGYTSVGKEEWKGKAMNNCPHCGAEDNNGGTFLCGTRYVGYVGTETFRSQQCRDRVAYKKRSKDKAMNHIGDGNKMVSDTPRTDVESKCGQGVRGRCYVSVNFSMQLERELQEAQERIRLLIAERDSARQQADLNWKMREEFTALLGTDDVGEAVRKLQLMKAALECAFPECEYLHHKKAHQHARGGKCVPEELVRMAQKISTTQTK